MRFAPQLLATALAVSTMSLALAHDDAPARSPVGSWKGVAQATTVPLPPLTTLFTLGADGTMVESRRLYVAQSPLGPLIATPGHGQWKRGKHGRYDATITLLYEGAPDHPTSPGVLVGSEKVRYQFQLVNGGANIQGTIVVEVKDVAGNVVFVGPGTIDAERIGVEALP
jgi:hypothetical protein